MILIFGGAYQGKLAYAQERFGTERTIINELDQQILTWVQAGEDVPEKIRQFIATNSDAVVICNDISCGVVPMDAIMRKWREETGRAMGALARHSTEVVRLFCGIPTRVK